MDVVPVAVVQTEHPQRRQWSLTGHEGGPSEWRIHVSFWGQTTEWFRSSVANSEIGECFALVRQVDSLVNLSSEKAESVKQGALL